MQNVKFIYFDKKTEADKKSIRPIGLTIQQIRNCIGNIERLLTLPEDNFDILKDICFDLIRRIPLFVKTYPNGFVLRARPNETEKPFTNISEISYHPNPKLVKIGRFNYDEDPVFYCSEGSADGDNADAALTTMLESCKEILDPDSKVKLQYLTIGKWKILKPITAVFLSRFENAEKNCNYFEKVNEYLYDQSEDLFEAGEQEKCSLIYNYFSMKAGTATDSRKGYLITTAFYHSLKKFYKTDAVAIVYSSAATDNYGLNMALSPAFFIEKYLEFELCVMYKCQRDPFIHKKFEMFPCSTEGHADENGNFEIIVNR
jgi:hypothetical protein